MGEFFGAKLRAHREARGLSGNALAVAAGISQGNLAGVERGDRRPSDAILDAIAAVPVLGLSRDRLEALRAADDIGRRSLWLILDQAPDLLLDLAAEFGPPGVDRSIVKTVTPTTNLERSAAYVKANEATITGGCEPLSPKEIELVAELRLFCAGNLYDLALGPNSPIWADEKSARLRSLKHALKEQRAAGMPAQEGAR